MKLFATLVFSTLTSLSFAQVDKLNWSKDISIGLGKGVVKNFPIQKRFNCFDMRNAVYKSIDNVGTNGAVESNLSISIVTSRKELDNILGVSGKVAAHTSFSKVLEKFGMPAVSLSGGFGKKDFVDESSLALVVSLESDYGRYEVTQSNGEELELKQEYKDMLSDGRYDEFLKKCGTHYVSQENRTGRVTAIIKITNLTKEKKIQLAASLNLSKTLNQYQPLPNPQGTGGTIYDQNGNPIPQNQGPAGGYIFKSPFEQDAQRPGLSLGIDNFLKSAKDVNGSIEISISAKGGGGIADHTKIFENAEAQTVNFKGLMDTVAQYAKSFRVYPSPNDMDQSTGGSFDANGNPVAGGSNATTGTGDTYNKVLPGSPTSYYLTSYEIYGLPKSKTKDIINNDLLEEVYYLYMGGLGTLRMVESQLDLADASMENEVYSQLYTHKLIIEKYLKELIDIAKAILDKDFNNDPTFESLPEKPAMKVQDLILSLVFSKKSLVCSNKDTSPSSSTISCGTKANFWTSGSYPLWKAYYEVEGKVGAPHLLESIILREVNSKTGLSGDQLLILKPGDSLSDGSLDSKGNFKLTFKVMDQNKGIPDYIKARNNEHKFEVILKAVDGSEKVYSISDIGLVGKHMSLSALKSQK